MQMASLGWGEEETSVLLQKNSQVLLLIFPHTIKASQHSKGPTSECGDSI